MHEGEIVRQIRLLRGLSQGGAGMGIGITQQGFSKLEKKESIPEKKLSAILIALNSSQQEFEVIKNLLYPPAK